MVTSSQPKLTINAFSRKCLAVRVIFDLLPVTIFLSVLCFVLADQFSLNYSALLYLDCFLRQSKDQAFLMRLYRLKLHFRNFCFRQFVNMACMSDLTYSQKTNYIFQESEKLNNTCQVHSAEAAISALFCLIEGIVRIKIVNKQYDLVSQPLRFQDRNQGF